MEALAVELMDTDEMEELEASETTIPFLELKTGIKAWLEEQASAMDSLEIKENGGGGGQQGGGDDCRGAAGGADIHP